MAELIQRYNDAKSNDYYDRKRGLENLSLYAPTSDWEVWSTHQAENLKNLDLPPNHYNFMQLYVEGSAGNFLINKIDPKFIDRSDDSIDNTETLDYLKRIYYSDKNFMKYNKSHREAIINGGIYRGIEEIKIVRTVDEPMGRISFESLAPTQVLFDPYNTTDNIARGSSECWKRFYLSPKQMAWLFPQMEPDIRRALLVLQQPNESYGLNNMSNNYPEADVWGTRYEVIEYYYKKQTNKKIAIDKSTGTILPETDYEFGTENDFFAKLSWANEQGIDLQPENIATITTPTEELNVSIFCPSLALQIDDRPDERQLFDSNGEIMLPFFTWSFITKGGKSFGIVDLGKTMQTDLNKREAAKTKIITKTPINGKPWVHPLAYGEDENNKQKFINEYNDPTKPFVFDADAPPGLNLFGISQPSQLNPVIMQDETFKMVMMDKTLRLPPAMQGQMGKSAESGILHTRKVIEGNIMQKVPSETLEDYQNEKFRAWLQLAIKIYGGRNKEERMANLNRVFHTKDNEKFTVNKLVGFDQLNEPIVENDLSKLRNIDVIISANKDNDYMKQQRREVDIAFLQAMQPSPTNMGYRAIVEADLARNIDGIDEETLNQIEEMSKLSAELAKKQMMAKSIELDVQINQLLAAQQQSMMKQQETLTNSLQDPRAIIAEENAKQANQMLNQNAEPVQ